MPMSVKVLLLFITLVLAACSPALNWREVRIKGANLAAMLPCKPDEGSRVVPLGGKDIEMYMSGCDAADATFAVAHVKLAQAANVSEVVSQWRTATLGNMGATSSTFVRLRDPLGDSSVSGAMLTAQGQRKDGTAVQMQGVWFARGTQIFHAVVYAQSISPEITEIFFPGLRLQ